MNAYQTCAVACSFMFICGALFALTNPYMDIHGDFVAAPAAQNTYYVSPTGSAEWANCNGAVALSGTEACSLDTANANIVAGDRVYLRGGTYATHIFPASSGTSVTNRIEYVAYGGETPVIRNTTKAYATYYHGVALIGRSYVKVDGVTVENPLSEVPDGKARLLMITHGGSYNELTNCRLDGKGRNANISIWDGKSVPHPSGDPATNNWIHGCVIENTGYLSSNGTYVDDKGGMMVGVPAYDNNSNYNTIEDNVFFCGGHHNLETHTKYNVVRGNFFHHEGCMVNETGVDARYGPDSNGKWGNRNYQIYDGYNEDKYNLVEGNRFGFAGTPPDDEGGDGLTVTAPKNIIRYNDIYRAANNGILMKTGGSSYADNNRIYNNTVYANGRYDDPGAQWQGVNFRWYGHYNRSGNVVMNNIFYQYGGDYPTDFMGGSADIDTINTVTSNWMTASGDPQFVSTNTSNPASQTNPNLSLQSSSPAVNQGAALTVTTNSGSGTSLKVADALFFQDGSWGSAVARYYGNFQADWIAVGSVTNVARISSVNYSTNTITLASSISWNAGDSVWLYKDSYGTRVLYGDAPDLGAHETTVGGTPVVEESDPEPDVPPSTDTTSSEPVTTVSSGSSVVSSGGLGSDAVVPLSFNLEVESGKSVKIPFDQNTNAAEILISREPRYGVLTSGAYRFAITEDVSYAAPDGFTGLDFLAYYTFDAEGRRSDARNAITIMVKAGTNRITTIPVAVDSTKVVVPEQPVISPSKPAPVVVTPVTTTVPEVASAPRTPVVLSDVLADEIEADTEPASGYVNQARNYWLSMLNRFFETLRSVLERSIEEAR